MRSPRSQVVATLAIPVAFACSGTAPSASSLETAPPVEGEPRPAGPAGPAGLGNYDYESALSKSVLFYEAQRSGSLPPNNRIPWRGDSALDDHGTYPPTGARDDLTGGWYEAGNNMKFNFPKAASATLLTWGMLEFEAGYASAVPPSVAVEQIKWETDYILKATAHADESFLWAQVGNPAIDFEWWGRSEDMTMERPAYFVDASSPGSDLAGEFAASLAAASILFRRNGMTEYADALVARAKQTLTFGEEHRGLYHKEIPGAKQWYESHGYEDELAWGNAWLHRATNDPSYLEEAKAHFGKAGCSATKLEYLEVSWDDKCPGTSILLAGLTNDATYLAAAERFFAYWVGPAQGDVARHVEVTPKGLAFKYPWGSLAYAANASLAALVYRKTLRELGVEAKEPLRAALIDFAIRQVHYILGDSGHSFMVGYGKEPPVRPHHPTSTCPIEQKPCMDYCADNSRCANAVNPGPNPLVLTGALVGGPSDAQDAWSDDRMNYITNEVSVTYNAGLQGALAGLLQERATIE